MDSYDRIEAALKNALDAGDTEAAEYLGNKRRNHPQYERRKAEQLQEVDEQLFRDPGGALGAIRSGLQGASFGFADELGAAIVAASEAGRGRGDFGDVYRDTHQQFNEEQALFEERNPGTALVAEVAGAIPTGFGIGRAIPTVGGRIGAAATGAGVGFGEGAIYGAGKAASLEEIPDAAAREGAVGAAADLFLRGTGKLLEQTVKPVGDAIGGLFTRPSDNAAVYAGERLASEGVSTQALADALRGDSRLTVADVSGAMRDDLDVALNTGGFPGVTQQARNLFQQRQGGQQQRLTDSLYQQMGIGPDADFWTAQQNLIQRRSQEAAPLYEQAFQTPIKTNDEIEAVLSSPAGQRASQLATDAIGNQRAGGAEVSGIQYLHEVKRALDGMIGEAQRSGNPSVVMDLTQVKNRLLAQIDEQVPAYRDARKLYADESSVLQAGETGRQVFKMDPSQIKAVVGGMSPTEADAFRLGAGKEIRDRMERASASNDAGKRLAPEWIRERMRAAFPSEDAFKQFMTTVEIEQQIFDTKAVLANSRTAQRQSGAQRQEGLPNTVSEGVLRAFNAITDKGLSADDQERLAKFALSQFGDVDFDAMVKAIKGLKVPAKSFGPIRRAWESLWVDRAVSAGVAPIVSLQAQSQKPTREDLYANALRSGVK